MSQDRKTGGWTAALIALIVLAPLLYVLSIGPAIWLHHRDLVPEQPLTVFYAPLEWTDNTLPDPLLTPLHWYIDLWDGPDMAIDLPATAPLTAPPVDYSPAPYNTMPVPPQ